MKLKWMMNNSKGKPDAMLTFAFWSFLVVSACIVLSCLKSVAFRTLSIELTMPDTSLLLGYLAATFGSYVTKRYHDVKSDNTSTVKKIGPDGEEAK